MEKNIDLAYQVLDYIREHPEEWNQDAYVCGSTMCYAGTAVMVGLGLSGSAELQEGEWGGATISLEARRLLGWTRRECDHVFLCYTTDFAVLEKAVKKVLNGEIDG